MSDKCPPYRRHADTMSVVALAVFDTVMTLMGGSWWPAHPGALAWVLLDVQAAVCLSLVMRRRFPLVMVGVLFAYSLTVTLLVSPVGVLTPAQNGTVWAPYASVLAAYAPIPRYQRGPRVYIPIAALTLVVTRPWDPSLAVIGIGLCRTAVGPLLALYFDARRRLVQALTERAERAERERHLLAEQARADERARLAGEMHDVVTHRVSLMVLQAGALGITAKDEETRRAAEDLRAAGVQALDELRDLVGILRTEPEEYDTPSTPGIASLVAESAAVGTPTTLTCQGDPALASPVVGRTAYRVVREALTNVRKHAPGSRVEVCVRYEPAGVYVTIRNTPPTRRLDPALAGTGSGLGIAGLRQRIELLRGTLHAGPDADGGFRVAATLPAYVPTAESVVEA